MKRSIIVIVFLLFTGNLYAEISKNNIEELNPSSKERSMIASGVASVCDYGYAAFVAYPPPWTTPNTLQLDGSDTLVYIDIWMCRSGTMDWSVSESIPWLSFNPTSGTVIDSNNYETVILSLDWDYLFKYFPPGEVSELVTFNFSMATPYNLTVIVDVPPLEPILEITTDSLDWGISGGWQSFYIENSGNTTLNWTISESCPWITNVVPISGTVGTGSDFDQVDVQASTLGLTPGTVYKDSLILSSDGGDTVIYTVIEVLPLPGASCSNPLEFSISAGSLPYSITNKTTCSHGDNYNNTCLGYYDSGEDLIIKLNVTSNMLVDITLDPKGTNYTGISISDACPDNGGTCIAYSTYYGNTPHMMENINLSVGTYYIMVDTWPPPECIDNFDIIINQANLPPVISDIPDQTIIAGESFNNINLDEFVTDPTNSDSELSWSFSGNSELIVNIDSTTRIATISSPYSTWTGSEIITFRVTDPELLWDTNSATFTVITPNKPPVLDPIGDKSIDENQLLLFNIYANDSNMVTPSLTMTHTNLPPTASFVDNKNGTGTFSWATTYDDSGTYTAVFFAFDGVNPDLVDSEKINIIVNNINRPPVFATIDTQEVTVGQELTFDVHVTDPDNTIPALTFSGPVGSSFTDRNDGTGEFKWTPTIEYIGTQKVIFYANDDLGGKDTLEVLIEVYDLDNEAPYFTSSFTDTTVMEGDEFTLTVTASDADNDDVTFECLQCPNNAYLLDQVNQTYLKFNPDYNDVDKNYTIRIGASDGIDQVDTSFNIEVINRQLSVVKEENNQIPPPPGSCREHLVTDTLEVWFNEPVDSNSLINNISIISRLGEPLPNILYQKNQNFISIVSSNGVFTPLDRIGLIISKDVVDLSGYPIGNEDTVWAYFGPVVYPGDADNNGVVDERDILLLGIFWGSSGCNRHENPELRWYMNAARAWRELRATFADMNGDGSVDADDICCVSVNWGKNIYGTTKQNGVEIFPDLAVKELSTSVIEQLYYALADCPDGTAKQALQESFENLMKGEQSSLPHSFKLNQNYPNPFNPSTTIEFSLLRDCHVELAIYDLLGKMVASLIDEPMSRGTYTTDWHGIDEDGNIVSSGIYFYKIKAGEFTDSKKMILLK